MLKIKNNNENELKNLKWEYYKTIKGSNKGVTKCEVRAYIGLSTWIYEKEYIQNGEEKFKAHSNALEAALDDYDKKREKNEFVNNFKENLRVWRESNKKIILREPGGEPLYQPPVRMITEWEKNGLTQISLFSGAFGLDLGFMAAGFDPRVALDIEKSSCSTIKANLPDIPFINCDINNITTKKLLKEAGLGVGEVDVLVGGPPCQPFSTAGKRLGLKDPRASSLREFIRVVKEAQPRCFVMEEVPGLQSARLKHISIAERDNRAMLPDEESSSAFKIITRMLKETGYNIKYEVLNAADYGAPQSRKRLIFIGLRDSSPFMPEPTHSNSSQLRIGDEKTLLPWTTLWDVSADLQGSDQEFSSLSPKTKKYMELVPPGGNWKILPKEIQKVAMGGAYDSGGGKTGYYRRLTWDEPSPTVVASLTRMATSLCHPEELRPLSIEEYKRVQGFPDDWKIPVSIPTMYKLIGNAVPVHLSHAIALKVKEMLINEN
jgi:DNA (cytosine-5)-methyltransferase 1